MINETEEGIEEFCSRAIRWLVDSPIRGPAGEVYSWLNPKKPGYVYPEIMGYYVRLFSYFYKSSGKKEYLQAASKTADRLAAIASPSGAVGRDGREYVFDSAICLSGFLALARVSGEKKYEKKISTLSHFVFNSLEKKTVALADGNPLEDENTWSLSFGASALKACISLMEAADFLKKGEFRELSEKIADEIVRTCFKSGFFTINPQRQWVYTHPHCYATEGLLFLQARGYDFSGIIERSADWLSENQNEDGSLFGWYYHPGQPEERKGDATSQAVRIWLCVDKKKYEENIRKGFKFLKELQISEGGLLYSKGSADINSWVTMFASQAAWWYMNKAEKEWIV